MRKITHLFKAISIGIEFRSTNTIYDFLKPGSRDKTGEFTKTGIFWN